MAASPMLLRRFSMIQRKLVPLVIALVIVLFPFGFGLWWLHEMWMKTEQLPLELKLADCTNNMLHIHLEIPIGHAYQLELKGPGIGVLTRGEWMSSYKFSGHMRVLYHGSLLADVPISSDKAWLTGSSYVLTGAGIQNTNVPPLSKFIQPNRTYDFEISFEPPPPPASSVWLYWLRSGTDTQN